ncbi:hypothetical protein [Rubinisphaera italica]|uniref:Transmembrane protein n=1 Tax=Rubinisphaera italica TaxID=2527969 RepID=A0A5C5XJS5_9PLAN|nr:hypothetical protein [Rubinisphaera italica]TWT62641.1 hypothetical protein Pan54_33850 [Rubinisphaera italica]
MTWSQRCEQWAREIRESQDLQASWAIGVTWITLGLLMLSARVLSGFHPEADLIRQLGLSIALLGLGVMSIGYVLRNRLLANSERDQVLCIAGLISCGIFCGLISSFPASSVWAFCLMTLITVGSTLLIGSRLLSFFATDSSAEIASAPEIHPASQTKKTESVVEDEQVIQWLSRKRQSDGSEVLEGMLRLEMAAGQKQMSAHAVFTPSLSSHPEIECEPLGDADVEASIGEVYPHGFRVDVRRNTNADKPLAVEIGFQAVAAANSKHAA